MMTTTNFSVVMILTGTTTALMAGLFYAWSCSVTVGLADLPDKEYISAMQSMNRAIQNPAFFICFFGAAILLPLSAYLQFRINLSARFWFLLAATICYLVGVMGVTIAGNVPMNEALDALQLHSASIREIAAHRARFEGPWNSLNMVRTISSIFSIACFLIACLWSKGQLKQ